jgi:hypothetical protein
MQLLRAWSRGDLCYCELGNVEIGMGVGVLLNCAASRVDRMTVYGLFFTY